MAMHVLITEASIDEG